MTGLLLLLATLAGVVYFYWRSKRSRLYELAEKLPGPPGLPLIGFAHQVLFKPHNQFFDMIYQLSFKKEFQNLAKAWLGPRLIVVLVEPRDVELVLSSNVLLKKSNEYKFFQPWFGNGLLVSSGDTWKKHRKMIAPTFHLNVLKRFMEQFNIRGRCLVEKMRKEDGKEFDCHDYMSECTVETLVETVMGVKQSFQGRTCYDYAMAVMEMCDILHTRQTRLWLRPQLLFKMTKIGNEHDKLLKQILNFTNRVFKRKKEDVANNKFAYLGTKDEGKEIESKTDDKFSYGQSAGLKDDLDVEDNDVGEKKRLAFLESLLDRSSSGDGMTEQEIKDQVNTLMFEGHDTTAAGSSFFLSVMAARQDIQDKCIEEIDRIFGDSDRDVTFKDTLEMKYLERCIMETLRLYPPVPLIARKLERELKLASEDLIVPAGCTLVIGIVKLHRRPDVYENPDEFNPDNFLPEKSANRHYYSFIPFSAGPRSCVGRKYAMLKLKIILAHILRKYRVAPGKPMKDWVLQADIILKRTDGFNIQLVERKPMKVY